MLTADLIRPRLRARGDAIATAPLQAEQRWVARLAEDLLAIFRAHVGCPRRDLHAALEAYEGARLDYILIRGLSKVLADAAVFVAEPAVEPAELRGLLFSLAARRGPVSPRGEAGRGADRDALLAEAAARYGLSTRTVEESFYADLQEEQILTDLGQSWTAQELVARYNLELARGLLYWASEMRITVEGGYKDLFKYIKLFKLMHEIRPLPGGGYHITIDGPISPFVASTLRYGGQMALFLPGLMLCPRWSMEADIHSPWRGKRRVYRYRLDASANLRSHYKASDAFDSQLEEDFAAAFEAKMTRSKRKWTLAREDEIVPVGDTVMIPDFSFTHVRDGRRALVELAGFWHPDYLQKKAWKLRSAGRTDLVLVAFKSVNTTDATWRDVPGEVLLFTSKPVIKDVLAAVERCAVAPDAPSPRAE